MSLLGCYGFYASPDVVAGQEPAGRNWGASFFVSKGLNMEGAKNREGARRAEGWRFARCGVL
jgi:hypothetical protein